MSIFDVFKASSIRKENERLTTESNALKQELAEIRSLLAEIGGNDVERAKVKAAEYDANGRQLKNELEQAQRQKEEVQTQVEQKRAELLVLDDELLLESFALYKPKFAMTSSGEYKRRIETVRDR